MNVFDIRQRLVDEYREYVQSFVDIADPRIEDKVSSHLSGGELWPEPLLQLNPSFETGKTVDELVDEGLLCPRCRSVFRIKSAADPTGKTMRLHLHQEEAIRAARRGSSYVLTTGTGSGKSLAYIIPIVDHVLRNGTGNGIQAIVVYPMNALANSQMGELDKFIFSPEEKRSVSFKRYTGQESQQEREQITANPPDILLTNYMMLELILTRWRDKELIRKSGSLAFLVLDELHTYRGRQGADVALLVRRVREAFGAPALCCVGTSATMAGGKTAEEQRIEVAAAASCLFGVTVSAEDVIGETLRRSTVDMDAGSPAAVMTLTESVVGYIEPAGLDEYYRHPFSSWIETAFGLEREEGTGILRRRKPRSAAGPGGAAADLAGLTGLDEKICAEAIRRHLLAGYRFEDPSKNGQPPFAFRIHQFFSRGDSVYATLEPKDTRYISMKGQQYVPGDRSRVLYPLVFCRECGAEFAVVRLTGGPGGRRFERRELSDTSCGEHEEIGFLTSGEGIDWMDSEESMIQFIPDDMVKTNKKGETVLKPDARNHVPRAVSVRPDGTAARDNVEGVGYLFIPAPFRFCPHCGVAYSARSRGDFGKLATLGTEGRSSVITLLSLSMVRMLKEERSIPKEARKLLSFTDNRQDAALQAGHFNDFIQVGLLRSALYRAVALAGPYGLSYDELVGAVFKSLNLPFAEYAKDPELKARFAIESTNKALMEVIGYRIYRDLERGWRILLPNLEQCGLLVIEYDRLREICADDDTWDGSHQALVAAAPEIRERVAEVLLDIMRRGLAINVEYLDGMHQDTMRSRCRQYLLEEDATAWTLGESERLFTSAVLWPSSRGRFGNMMDIFLSGYSGYGQFLRRNGTFPGLETALTVKDSQQIIRDLLEILRGAGLVEPVDSSGGEDPVTGYRLKAAAMRWKAGDGKTAPHDPVRMLRPSARGVRINPFFVKFYREVGSTLGGLEAREHTAQVKAEDRESREKRFGTGELPVLYASATLELGVDIKSLNAVNMRNIPPTPANYAQRSGRAGRNGQPAIVFSYCSTYRSHDQYFFRRPLLMVAGAVGTPRIDLSNEDLVRSHVHAVWLSESGVDLKYSMTDVLDTSILDTLPVFPSISDQLRGSGLKARVKQRVRPILDELNDTAGSPDWYGAGWIDETLDNAYADFDRACDRWRTLYRTAKKQAELHGRIVQDHSRNAEDKRRSKILRAEAEAQIELLTSNEGRSDADFYTYRYFASEGFLPGYNFPRLPLSAYIPGKRPGGFAKPDQFLSRPRFLAVSEFGPRSMIYHDGSRFRIDRVIMETNDVQQADARLPLSRVKVCPACGYLHIESGGSGFDLCDWCGAALKELRPNLFRMQNVSTRRVDRINSDEEERTRTGYRITTAVRFSDHNGVARCVTSDVKAEGRLLARISYGPAAIIWRINRGWKKRAPGSADGFVLDVERGYWARNDADDDDDSDANPLSPRTERVIPYVEDRRNCLLVRPAFPEAMDDRSAVAWMASFEAAFRTAIREEFDLEDAELASEPLPDGTNRRIVLVYEAAEGGAGVLGQIISSTERLNAVGRRALEICHFDPAHGADLGAAVGETERCEAACYDCLMSYGNQQDHKLLDRFLVRDWFLALCSARVETAPGRGGRAAHLEELLSRCDSELERDWLRFLEAGGYNLPGEAQVLIPECGTRPDFLYREHGMAVYIDGPIHDYPERAARDRERESCLDAMGFNWIVRFGHSDEWQTIVKRYPSVFGRGRE